MKHLGASLFVLLIASHAGAGEAPVHDAGLHVRFAMGGAYASFGVAMDPESDLTPDTSVSGGAVGGMLLLGWTLADGLAVGAGMSGFHVFSPTVTLDDKELDGDFDAVAGAVTGPYAEWYLDPAGGLHLLGQLGLATLQDADQQTDDLATGFGVTVGVGYDVYVGDKLSVGGLARLQYLSVSVDHQLIDAKLESTYTGLVPGLLVTAVWN